MLHLAHPLLAMTVAMMRTIPPVMMIAVAMPPTVRSYLDAIMVSLLPFWRYGPQHDLRPSRCRGQDLAVLIHRRPALSGQLLHRCTHHVLNGRDIDQRVGPHGALDWRFMSCPSFHRPPTPSAVRRSQPGPRSSPLDALQLRVSVRQRPGRVRLPCEAPRGTSLDRDRWTPRRTRHAEG